MHDEDKVMAFAGKMMEERHHQAERWGGGDFETLNRQDDERNGISDWFTYMGKYATNWLPDYLPPWGPKVYRTFRTCMVKVGTLAYAAHEWAGRWLERNGYDLHEDDSAE